jgi:UDP-N-acetylmuramate dehydrogenase
VSMETVVTRTMDQQRLGVLEARLRGLGLDVRRDEPMRAHTTYQIGGPADLFVVAQSEAKLVIAIREARAAGIVPLVLGGGANLLVADAGIRGLVVHYCGTRHAFRTQDGDTLLSSEAGADLKTLARESIARGLKGLEWAVDVPGTLGGAVVGNAGAYGGYICDSLLSVKVLESDGTIQHLKNAECGFCYRDSRFKQQLREERTIVLSATLMLRSGNAKEIAAQAAQYTEYRGQRHPDGASCGSVFKRTPKYPAGFLIEQCGVKGERRGNAMISLLHANYILNLGDAMAIDVKALIDLIQEQVKAQFDEDLELEVELVGEW